MYLQQCTLFLSHSTTSRYSANCEIFFKNYAAFQKRRKRKSASIKKYFCPQNQFTDIIDTFFASSLVGTLQNQGRDTNLLYLYDPINRKVIKSWRLSVIVKNFAYPIEKDNCSDNIFSDVSQYQEMTLEIDERNTAAGHFSRCWRLNNENC